MRHQHCLGETGAAIVERGVGNLHARQLGDVGLKLEDCLQGALRDFCLIRRVRGVELGPRDQRINDDGDVVPVNAGPNERRSVYGIPCSSLLEVFNELRFRQRFWDVQQPPEPQFFRNARKKLFDGFNADFGEHPSPVGLRVWDISHVWENWAGPYSVCFVYSSYSSGDMRSAVSFWLRRR